MPPATEAALVTTKIWARLKAAFFTIVMVLQSIVDSLVYTSGPDAASNPMLASDVIIIFAHLTFVSSKFGGLSNQGETSFREYNRAFYTAVDIVATCPPKGEELVRGLENLRKELKNTENVGEGANSPLLAMTTFYFTAIELLVDQLSTSCISEIVLPACER